MHMSNGRKVEPLHVPPGGRAAARDAGGRVRHPALRARHAKAPGESRAQLWLAKDRFNLPVRVVFEDAKGLRLDQTLVSLTTALAMELLRPHHSRLPRRRPGRRGLGGAARHGDRGLPRVGRGRREPRRARLYARRWNPAREVAPAAAARAPRPRRRPAPRPKQSDAPRRRRPVAFLPAAVERARPRPNPCGRTGSRCPRCVALAQPAVAARAAGAARLPARGAAGER